MVAYDWTKAILMIISSKDFVFQNLPPHRSNLSKLFEAVSSAMIWSFELCPPFLEILSIQQEFHHLPPPRSITYRFCFDLYSAPRKDRKLSLCMCFSYNVIQITRLVWTFLRQIHFRVIFHELLSLSDSDSVLLFYLKELEPASFS